MARIDRRRFLQLGVAGVVGLGGVFASPGYVAANRSVRVTDPEFGAVGDGVADDGPAIRRALSDPTVKEVVLPRSRGYAVDMGRADWKPLPLRAGVRLVGYDSEGPLIRTGAFVNGRFMFANEHSVTRPSEGVAATGDDGITVQEVCIQGRMHRVDLSVLDDPGTPQYEASVNTAIAVRSQGEHGRSEGFRLLGCRITDWPGVAVSCSNLTDFVIEGNTISRAHRGGLVLNFVNARGTIAENTVLAVGDDAIGLNADGNGPVPEERGPSTEIEIRSNTLSRMLHGSRTPGPVLAVRGGNAIVIEDNTILHGAHAAVYLERRGGVSCRVNVTNNHAEHCPEGALFVQPRVEGVASGNTSVGCSRPGSSAYRNLSDAFVLDETNDPPPPPRLRA